MLELLFEHFNFQPNCTSYKLGGAWGLGILSFAVLYYKITGKIENETYAQKQEIWIEGRKIDRANQLNYDRLQNALELQHLTTVQEQ